MLQYNDLNDLLRSDPAAHSYFYDLPCSTQNRLQKQDIHNFSQLREAVVNLDIADRPQAF